MIDPRVLIVWREKCRIRQDIVMRADTTTTRTKRELETTPRNEWSRRRFVQAAGGALVAAIGPRVSLGSPLAAGGKPPLIIDCHAHIYGEDPDSYPTVFKPLRPPEGKGTVPHLIDELRSNGVSKVTAIQTSTFYRWDNRFTVDSARAHADSMAAVCTLNPDNPRSSRLLERYVNEGGVRGMRSVAAQDGRLDHPGVDKLWETAERLGIVINVLVGRQYAPQIVALVKRHPKLRIVIDHCLGLQASDVEPTVKAMEELAKLPTVHAKMTFLPTGSAEEYPCQDLHQACLRIIEAFTPDRCVWGSDFPCELWCPKVTYAQHLKIFTHKLGLDDAAKSAVLGKTAQRLWFDPL